MIQSRFFRAWEGGGRFSLGDSWVNANLTRGHQHFAAKQYKEALADYQAALQTPANLQESAGNTSARKGEITYWIAAAYEALGDLDKARASWREASGVSTTQPATDRGGRSGRGGRGGRGGGGGSLPPGQFSGRGGMGGIAAGVRVAHSGVYYQALALQKLGEADRAKTLFQQLVDTGMQSLAKLSNATPGTDVPLAQRIQAADAHYLTGLGQLGLSENEKAKQELTLALQTIPTTGPPRPLGRNDAEQMT